MLVCSFVGWLVGWSAERGGRAGERCGWMGGEAWSLGFGAVFFSSSSSPRLGLPGVGIAPSFAYR